MECFRLRSINVYRQGVGSGDRKIESRLYRHVKTSPHVRFCLVGRRFASASCPGTTSVSVM